MLLNKDFIQLLQKFILETLKFMKLKFYKKSVFILSLVLSIASSNLQAQNQGMYADTIKWPNSNTITVNLRSRNFSNVINFQGTVKWDVNSLQLIPVSATVAATGNAALGSSNF